MDITVAIIVTAITLIFGEITKVFNMPTKYLPIQNIVIAILASIVCIVFKVQNLSILETVLTCIFASLGAGGVYDLAKIKK